MRAGFSTTLLTLVGENQGCSAPVGDAVNDDGRASAGLFDTSGRPRANPAPDSRLPIVWLEAGVCTGCACSLLDSAAPNIEDALPELRLEFQETLMDRSGPSALDDLLALSAAEAGRYLLIVDGGVPGGELAEMGILGVTRDGEVYTSLRLVQELAKNAGAALALGTCAAFGGVLAARPNPTNSQPLANLIPEELPLVRVPGCPPHPAWILGPLRTILSHSVEGLRLDDLQRPLPYFGEYIHEHCPRRPAFRDRQFATRPGDPDKCLYHVGCRGIDTLADCSVRLWNEASSCIRANHPCVGCTSPGFPDECGADAGAAELPILPFYLDPVKS